MVDHNDFRDTTNYEDVFFTGTSDNTILWGDDTSSSTVMIDASGEQVDLSEFIKSVKESLGQSPVILKCGHCGQWGAKYCACRYCGAPIG